MSERKSASTHGYFSGSWHTLTGRHCAGVRFHSQSWSYSGTPPSNVSEIDHYEGVYIVPGTEIGYLGSDSAGNPPTGSSPPVSSLHGTNVGAGSDFVIQTSDTGAIESGRHLKWFVLQTTVTHYNDSTKPNPRYDYHWFGPTGQDATDPYDYLLIKLACNDASLTTRRTYGQPNKGGELPADPNAPLRHPIRNLGLQRRLVRREHARGREGCERDLANGFVRHGRLHLCFQLQFRGRIALRSGQADGFIYNGCLNAWCLFPKFLGQPPQLPYGESNVNWDHQWSITPGAVGSGSGINYSLHPFSTTTLTDGNSDDYVVLPINGDGGSLQPSTCLTGMCLAIVDEASTISANTQCWHYFASKEYQTGSTFPRNDCAPRVWLITPYSP